MENYNDGLNTKLLNSIPLDAQKVLELGCAKGKLGQRFKQIKPDAWWTGVELNSEAFSEAKDVLDEAYNLNLDDQDLSVLGDDFDVIVIGDLLEHIKSPESLLNKLYNISTDKATIVCCLPNMGHISVLQRMIASDITYDDMGLLDRTHLRFYTQPSAFKTFLDSGWLPDLKDEYRADAEESKFLGFILNAASEMGIPKNTALKQLGSYQMILKCRKWRKDILKEPGATAPFSVIVPVNRPWQFELNILKSPGLKEVGASIIPVENSSSAAEAYNLGLASSNTSWNIFAHQDVYFPTGTGFAITRHLGELEAEDNLGPIGFAGIQLTENGKLAHAGMVIDRAHLFSHEESNSALSIDEFAVALHKTSLTKIHPQLGWHLWGTDLCLQKFHEKGEYSTTIINVPLFHNSLNDYSLPDEFYRSAQVLLEIHPHLNEIPTLCGNITRPK